MKRIISMVLVCAVALTGCNHHDHEHEHEHESEHAHAHEHDHDHDHDHEEAHSHEHLLLAAYSEGWEVFAEAEPAVAGKPCEITAHFTRLSDFKPLESGEVSATIEIGGKTATQTLDKQVSKGIYKFTLTPPAIGKGTITFTVCGEQVATEFVGSHCAHDAEAYAEKMEVKSSNGASFGKEKSWKVDFATEECRVEALGQVVKAMAQVQPSQGEESVVTALTDGIVVISGGALLDGREVRQGEVLCKVKSGSMSDNNIAVRYSQAEAEYNLAKSEYERKQTLAADKIVSESELLQAKAAYETAKAAYFNLKNNFSQEGQNVKAPQAGYLTGVAVTNGQYVQAGQTLAVVSKSRSLQVVAEVQAKYYSCLRNISGATFRSMDSDRVWTLEELDGKVVSYGKSISADSPLIPVTFSISNKADFLPGSFVETYIKTTGNAASVTVANGALIEEQGNFFVYRQLTPEFFEKTQVKVGATDGERTVITSGLEGGERIVSKGAMLVKLAQASGALDPHAGHNH